VKNAILERREKGGVVGVRQRRIHGRGAFAIITLNLNFGGKVGLDQTFLGSSHTRGT
jgi:hypothetical protein